MIGLLNMIVRLPVGLRSKTEAISGGASSLTHFEPLLSCLAIQKFMASSELGSLSLKMFTLILVVAF